MKKVFIGLMAVVCGLTSMMVTAVHAEVKVGIMAPRGALTTMKQWGDLADHLKAALGSVVTIVPLKPSDAVKAMENGEVDFALTNPVLAVVMEKKLSSKPIATMNKKTGSYFAGVIITKKGSGLTKAADLKGKKVMGFKFKRSAAAYVFQVKHMLDQGIDPHKDFAVFKEAKKQDDIVLAVKSGLFDAGFIKSGLLEAMAKEGKISMDDFDIIDKKSDSLAHVHSTILYPEWTVSAGSKADAAISDKLKAALLKMDANTQASKSANIVGFVELVSLSDLDTTLQALKLPPYE